MSESPEATTEFDAARKALLGACEEMKKRLLGLRDTHGRIGDEIHQLRKLGKRLRGGLAVIGEPKPCLRWIAVIGRMLSGARDAHMRIRTWNSLGVTSTV